MSILSKTFTGWDKSFWGGSLKVIREHPPLSYSGELEIELSTNIVSELGSYYGEKLCKMYLHHLQNSSIKSSLTDFVDLNQEYEILEKSNFLGKNKKRFYKVPFSSFISKEYINRLNGSFTEYKELYREYLADLKSSYILIPAPEEEQEEQGSSEKENNEKKDSENSSENADLNDLSDNSEQQEGEDPNGSESESENEGNSDKDNEAKDDRDEPGKSSSTASKISIQEFLKDQLDKIEIKKFEYNDTRLSEYNKKVVEINLKKKYSFNPSYKLKISPDCLKDSKLLSSLLDIDFDSKSDIIKNLKTGKIDTSRIAEVPAGNLNIYQRLQEDINTQPFSICILADMSGSMIYGGNRKATQKYILDMLHETFKDTLKGRLFIYGHSGEEEPKLYEFHNPIGEDYESNSQFYNKISFMENYDGPIIESIHKKVREYTDDKVLFLVLTDGEPCGRNYGGSRDITNLKQILEKASRDNFITCAVGIDAPGIERLYKYHTSIDSSNLNETVKKISKLINHVVSTELK